jgi:FtsZ-binding cell division protein ZapB
MISLEQIRLLEGKVTRAVELIRALKEENATLRRGLETAQRRMKELESLVEGFKADQKDIESAILRALGSLDELEESVASRGSRAPLEPARGRPDSAPADPVPPDPAPAAIDAKAAKDELDIF